jgi:serine/threonine protein kinase
MPETPQPTICTICRMPKQASKAGSITQWISVCRCDIAGDATFDESEASVNFCSSCGKRIAEGRHGSFTQWVFRGSGDTCECKTSEFLKQAGAVVPPGQTAGKSAEALAREAEIAEREEAAETELALSPDSFPVERYKPLAVLGRGASGVVYKCRDRLLKKKVAVKVLQVLSAEQLVLFQQEARAMSKLNHPGIVKILDFGALDSGVPFMVLELIEGRSLDSILEERGTLSLVDALNVFFLIADALEYAHKNGIFHRDLKPNNILVVDEAKPENEGAYDARLIDFGVAQLKTDRAEQAVVQGKTLVGTPAYMSADQLNGRAYDARSEIYSFGCVMFETLTGVPPYSADTALELLSKHQNEEPPLLGEMRDDALFLDDIEAIISKCLNKSPEDRFQNFRELKDALLSIRIENVSPIQAAHAQSNDAQTSGWNPLVKIVAIGFFVLFAVIGSGMLVMKIVTISDEEKELLKVKKNFFEKQTWDAGDDMYGVKERENTDKKFVPGRENGRDIYEASTDKVTDEDMRELASIPDLENLSIRGCSNITGTGFKYLKGKPLKRLDIKWIALTNEGAACLAELDQLTELNTCHINLNVKQVQEIAKIKTLQSLNICHCILTDESLKYIGKMPNLSYLNMEGNIRISDEGLKHLRNMPNLRMVRVLGCEKVSSYPKVQRILPHCRFELGNYMTPAVTDPNWLEGVKNRPDSAEPGR